MFYFNTTTRVARYEHNMPVGADGYVLDFCYDCASEVQILRNYLEKTHPELEGIQLTQKFCEMGRKCAFKCTFHRTLLDSNPDEAAKTRNIRAKQWVNGKPAYYTRGKN